MSTGALAGFFERCAFVSVDYQEEGTAEEMTAERLPRLWRGMGFTAEDVNAANAYLRNAALPNAVRVAAACRRGGMPMIFIHWGCLFEDGMDVDPEIRRMQTEEHGAGDLSWVPHISRPDSRPAAILRVQPKEYVIPKTGQDAFTSSSFPFVLENLGTRSLIFVGGHTGACLGRTSVSARHRGYATLCVHDATFDARESARVPNLRAVGYDHVVSTVELLEALETRSRTAGPVSVP